MARARGNKWQADATYQGTRKRRSFTTKAEAEAWEKAVALADERGTPMPGETGSRQRVVLHSHSIGGFINEQFDRIWGHVTSPQTPAKNLKSVEAALGSDFPINSIDYEVLLGLVDTFREHRNANSTINRKMSAISRVLKHAKALGYIDQVPQIPHFRERADRIRFFTEQEEHQIVRYFDRMGCDETRYLTEFLLYTGARRSEAHSLRKNDVDLTKGLVTFWKTKSGKPRNLPLTPKAREAVNYFLRTHPMGPVLVGIPYETYTEHWRHMRTALGMDDDPHFVPHTLRHTCASRLVQSGIDLRRVQQWMGHDVIATTVRYSHLAPSDLDIAATALSG